VAVAVAVAVAVGHKDSAAWQAAGQVVDKLVLVPKACQGSRKD
jgi:hypothetical protein